MRFSTVAGERGSADTVRDPRGFAIKFYTEDGNYDLVGNNTPVFFIRDPLKFPDFIHSQKRDPYTNIAGAQQHLGFLLAESRGYASIHDSVQRSRHPRQLSQHGRLRVAHLSVGQCARRSILGEVSFQDRPGHQESHPRGCGAHRRSRRGLSSARSVARDRPRPSIRRGRSRCRSCRRPTRRSTASIRSM